MLGWHWPFALPIIALPMAGLVAWKLDVPEGTTATQNDRGKSSLQSLWAVLRQPAVVGLLLASVMNFVLLFGSYVTYVPELVDRQFTSQSAIIGLVVSSASISNGIAATQVARMARLVARRWLVAGAFALSAAALAVIPLMASVWGVVAAAIGFGAAQGTGVTATLALLTDWAPDAQRATVLSVNATAIRLGQTIGPAVMGGVLAAAGLNAVFFAGGVLAVLMVGVLAVLLTTRPTASS
jgi:predicted MFS family arabinose efflux permease